MRTRDQLDLAGLWLEVDALDEAAAWLHRLDGQAPTLDERIEAAALRARLALARGDIASASRALGRADALAEALGPEEPVPNARTALEAARREVDDAVASCPVRGGYHLVRLLGEGGQGRVWEAVAVDGSRRVAALKELLGGGRLEREARLGGRLRHRHLVDVYGVGVDDGVAWCAMELCDGGSLASSPPLPPRAVVEVGLQVCEALAHANETLGLVHLDLKPDNLLLGGGVVKVADLGIAVVAADGVTRVTRGTPGYMAPEQRAGRPVDARTDIWALGVVLVELASGRRGASSQTFDWAAERPSTEVAGAPDWLAPVVARCVVDEPGDRFQGFRALAAALRSLSVDGPGLADLVGEPAPAARHEGLVGRGAELTRLLAALDTAGIVILEGPLGVGKTALARAALAALRARRGERDMELPAAQLGEPEALDRALAAAGPLEALGEGVVLLDHVVDARTVEAVRGWASRTPDLRWLLTSRLALPGDDRTRIEVAPLSVEDGHALVVARAAARGADVSDSASISSLVRRLGGLPLALELAAGRLGVYTAAELVEQLDPSWLRGGAVDLGETLRDVVAALDPAERRLVEALAEAPDGLSWAELADVTLPAGAEVLAVLDQLLSRSVVLRAGDRFSVPEVLVWSLEGPRPQGE